MPAATAANPSMTWNRETNGRMEETRTITSGPHSAPRNGDVSGGIVPGSLLKSLAQWFLKTKNMVLDDVKIS